jgi:hypothetical protein
MKDVEVVYSRSDNESIGFFGLRIEIATTDFDLSVNFGYPFLLDLLRKTHIEHLVEDLLVRKAKHGQIIAKIAPLIDPDVQILYHHAMMFFMPATSHFDVMLTVLCLKSLDSSFGHFALCFSLVKRLLTKLVQQLITCKVRASFSSVGCFNSFWIGSVQQPLVVRFEATRFNGRLQSGRSFSKAAR